MTDRLELSGKMARLAARLPRRGRMIPAFLLLILALLGVSGLGWMLEAHVGGFITRLLITIMAFIGFLIFCLLGLMQWRPIGDRLATLERVPEDLPGIWRMALLPYGRNDIETMRARGRLTELLILPFLIIVFIGFVYLAITVPHKSHAKESTMTELRTSIQATRSDIEKDYIRQSFPSPHAPFAFSVLIPRDWLWFEKEGRPTAPNGKPQLLIAYGDKTDQSLMEVLGFEVEREMAPDDWVREWLKVNNYEILAARVVPAASGRNADIKARKIVNGRPVLFRIRTFKNGRYIYILHGFSDEARYPEVEEAFLVAAESFQLTAVPQQNYAEPTQDLPLNKVFQLGFKMPISWIATPDTGVDADSQSWTLTNKLGDATIGIVNVFTAPRGRFKDENAVAAMSANWLRNNGVDFHGANLKPVDSGMPGVWIAVEEQKVQVGGSPGLVKQTIVRTDKGWAIFTLATKTIEPDPYLITAINRRGFDIAFGSFLTAMMPK
ncbi:hypothetical protein [Niveispirillum irakense]|uniref:hypothetical protein n=1 Tax=Niveispirillum irakense TaxID=34011 RepID=UPI00048AB71F|nr:hypothetical protein [Niveispirillum irakense]